jgi:hypothetical protein
MFLTESILAVFLSHCAYKNKMMARASLPKTDGQLRDILSDMEPINTDDQVKNTLSDVEPIDKIKYSV